MRRRLGVLGWPVAHSRSPAMHNAALAHLGLGAELRYQLLPVPPEAFAETVLALPASGFVGANVTIPHKEAALALADGATAAARAIGAANTLSFGDDGTVDAENTDAPGLLDCLGGAGAVRGRTALVLGAGGSAKAVVWALREAGATDVAVWNRDPARARALGARVVGGHVAADLLVNCTSVGLRPGDDPFAALPLTPAGLAEHETVVDLVYAEGDTALLAAARAAGCTVVDGVEFLVHQGARSLERWLGRPAPVGVMRAAARAGSARPAANPRPPA